MARDRKERLDWDRPRSGFTVEGQLEGIGDFARGLRRRRRVVRLIGLVLLIAFVVPVFVGVVVSILGR